MSKKKGCGSEFLQHERRGLSGVIAMEQLLGGSRREGMKFIILLIFEIMLIGKMLTNRKCIIH